VGLVEVHVNWSGHHRLQKIKRRRRRKKKKTFRAQRSFVRPHPSLWFMNYKYVYLFLSFGFGVWTLKLWSPQGGPLVLRIKTYIWKRKESKTRSNWTARVGWIHIHSKSKGSQPLWADRQVTSLYHQAWARFLILWSL
jgi:hypothetical protein